MELEISLTEQLLAIPAENYEKIIETNTGNFLNQERPFYDYIHTLKLQKGLKWTTVAGRICCTKKQLYKLISCEKITRQRDRLIRLGFGMHMSLPEMQKSLSVYGFSPLYVRRRRDLLLMKLLQDEIWDLSEADLFLKKYGEPGLVPGKKPVENLKNK